MIYIDWMSPIGHIRINKFYLDALWRTGDSLLVGGRLFSSYPKYHKYEIPSASAGYFSRFVVLIKIIIHILRLKDQKICFLSYDLFFMPALMCLLRVGKFKVYAFEHNTAPDKWIKRLFHRLCGRQLFHFAYADHICADLQRLGLSSSVVNHPAIVPEHTGCLKEVDFLTDIIKSKYKAIVFCPSGSVPWKEILNASLKNPDYFFVFKGRPLSESRNILAFERVEGYRELIEACDFIYIPFNWESKVSGPFYEAIASGKFIIMKDNKFGRFCKQLFPRQVGFNFPVELKEVVTSGGEEYNATIIYRLRLIMQI